MKMTLSIWLTSIFLHLGGSPFRKYGCTKIPGWGEWGGRGVMVGLRSIKIANGAIRLRGEEKIKHEVYSKDNHKRISKREPDYGRN